MRLLVLTKRGLAIIVIWFLTSIAYAQENNFIEGKLLDATDETPIPFATIKVKNKSKGLISNMDGGFKIPEKLKTLGDTLVISSIGYTSQEVLLSRLKKNEVNTIRLIPKVETLSTVIIIGSKKNERDKRYEGKKLSARTIIKTAIEQIPDNYPFDPFSYVGYYRDYQIKEKTYVNLNEAIMNVSDPGFGYQDKKHTRVQLHTYKRNTNFPIDTISSKPYDYVNKNKVIPNATLDGQGGNEYTILRLHDAIRNYNIDSYDFMNRFDEDLIKNHRLKLLPETSIDNIELYVVNIVKTQENYKAEGKVYVSKNDFKIYKLEYAVFDKRTPKKKKTASIKNTKFSNLLYEIIVAYQLEGAKMYPSYISFNNSFKVLQPPKFKPTDLVINHQKKRFELTFNNALEIKSTTRKNNYKLFYKNQKITIDSIAVKDKTALLYPKNQESIFESDMLTTFVTNKKEEENPEAYIELKNIKDTFGSVVNKQESSTYYQYREFFVQELKLNSLPIIGATYMSKNKPIYLNQPITILKNIDDYWMNTPLKK